MNSLRIEGQKTVGIEIVQQFDWEVPDWIVIPGGNLGNVSALAKGFDMMQELGLITRLPRIVWRRPRPRIRCTSSYQSDFEVFEPIAARPTLASAIQIGNPVSIEKAIDACKRYDGVVEQASEAELADACARADRTGLFNCPHTGVALAATEQARWNAGVIRNERSRRRDLDRARTQVRGLQGQVPHDGARGHRRRDPEPADRAARAVRGARRDASADRDAQRLGGGRA